MDTLGHFSKPQRIEIVKQFREYAKLPLDDDVNKQRKKFLAPLEDIESSELSVSIKEIVNVSVFRKLGALPKYK